MAKKQGLKKYTYNDVVFVQAEKRDTSLLVIVCIWVGADGKVHNDYIMSTEFVFDEALQGDTDYRKILFDCYRKFCPDSL